MGSAVTEEERTDKFRNMDYDARYRRAAQAATKRLKSIYSDKYRELLEEERTKFGLRNNQPSVMIDED